MWSIYGGYIMPMKRVLERCEVNDTWHAYCNRYSLHAAYDTDLAMPIYRPMVFIVWYAMATKNSLSVKVYLNIREKKPSITRIWSPYHVTIQKSHWDGTKQMQTVQLLIWRKQKKKLSVLQTFAYFGIKSKSISSPKWCKSLGWHLANVNCETFC